MYESVRCVQLNMLWHVAISLVRSFVLLLSSTTHTWINSTGNTTLIRFGLEMDEFMDVLQKSGLLLTGTYIFTRFS